MNLYDPEWPIHTYQPQAPPPKFVFAQSYEGGRMGVALDSMVAQGCIVSGGRVQNSILSPWVRVNSYSRIEDSILMEGVAVGRHCRIRKAIVDKNVRIPEGTVIGYDAERDRERSVVSPGGIAGSPRAPARNELGTSPRASRSGNPRKSRLRQMSRFLTARMTDVIKHLFASRPRVASLKSVAEKALRAGWERDDPARRKRFLTLHRA